MDFSLRVAKHPWMDVWVKTEGCGINIEIKNEISRYELEKEIRS